MLTLAEDAVGTDTANIPRQPRRWETLRQYKHKYGRKVDHLIAYKRHRTHRNSFRRLIQSKRHPIDEGPSLDARRGLEDGSRTELWVLKLLTVIIFDVNSSSGITFTKVRYFQRDRSFNNGKQNIVASPGAR